MRCTSPLIAVLTVYVLTANVSAEDSGWAYREIYNPVAETRTYIANIDTGGSEVELRCSARDRRTEVRLRLPVGRNHTSNLEIRFDNARSRKMSWQTNISGLSLQLPWKQVDEFARQLSAYNTLHVAVLDAHSNPPVYSIPLKRSAQAIANLRRRCSFN